MNGGEPGPGYGGNPESPRRRRLPRVLGRVPAPVLVVASIVGIQGGQAWGKQLFGLVDPLGVVSLRLGIAALVLLALHRPRIPTRPRLASLVLGLGTVIAGMNVFIYPALARLPVGMAVTLQFLGPF